MQTKEELIKEGLCIRCKQPNDNLPNLCCHACTKIKVASNMKCRHKRKENGKCPKCGKPTTESIQCTECTQKGIEWKNARIKRYLEKNLCIVCAKPLKQDETIKCKKCKIQDSVYNSRTKRKHLKSNKCTLCNNPAEEGKHLCKIHLQDNRIKAKQRYHDLKEQGLCVACGKEKAFNGVRCQQCKSRLDALKLKPYRKSVEEAFKQGVCACCKNKKEDQHYLYCNDCRETKKNLFWRNDTIETFEAYFIKH